MLATCLVYVWVMVGNIPWQSQAQLTGKILNNPKTSTMYIMDFSKDPATKGLKPYEAESFSKYLVSRDKCGIL